MEEVYREIGHLERMMTLFDEGSALSRLNRRTGGGPVRTEPLLAGVLEESLRLSRQTNGAFDVTVSPLMRLWGFRKRVAPRSRPSREEFAGTLRSIGHRHVRVDRKASTVVFLREGIEIDLGGVGKGFAVDRAVRVLKENGIRCALVSFGSVSYALGAPPGISGWRVGVRDPLDPNRLLGRLNLKNRAVASSGNDQQFRRLDGRRIPHVIDPRCGYPVEGVAGSTVVHHTATGADALSTGVMVLGDVEGMRILSRDPHVEGMMVVGGGGCPPEYRFSPGWGEYWIGSADGAMSRRGFVRAALLAFGSLLLIGRPLGSSIHDRVEEALNALFPDAVSIRKERMMLTPAQMAAAHEALGKRFRRDTYIIYTVHGDSGLLGRAVVLDVVGKERPITFLVVVAPEEIVAGVEVLAYREAIGGEIRSRRFLDQFRRKTLSAPLELGKDVQAITGATLSSRATGYAVRKALALIHAVYGAGGGGGGE
jgi:thiamine biosynthesis lipoprotein